MSGRLGVGAMINRLAGYEPLDVSGLVGRRVAGAVIDPDGNGGDGEIRLSFEGGSVLRMWDSARSCCESRWLHTDDDLAALAGGVLAEIRLDAGPAEDVGEWGDEKESMFLVVRTDRATATFVAYNEHNGYYGGIDLTGEVVSEEDAA